MLNVSPVNLLCIVLNLLILVVLMKKFLYKPVMNVIAKRQELLESQFAAAKESREEANKLKEQYEACLFDAKEEKESILKEAKVQAATESDRIIAEADKKAKQMISEAKETGRFEKEKALKEAEAEIAELAVEAVSKIVGRISDEKTDSLIYEEFLKEVGE